MWNLYIPSIWHPLQLERSKRWCSGRARRSTWWFLPRNIYKYHPTVEGWGTRGPNSFAVSLTRVIHEEGRPDESRVASRIFPSTRRDSRNHQFKESRLVEEGTRMGHDKIDVRLYRTWEIIPDEMHFGIIAWPSTILRPDRLWRSWGPALRVWSRCNKRDCLSWVVKNRISSSLPSKQLASEPTNSLSPPPNSCLRDFGRCISSAALSRLRVDPVTSMQLFLIRARFSSKCALYTLLGIEYLHAKWCRNVKPVTVRRGVMSHMNY